MPGRGPAMLWVSCLAVSLLGACNMTGSNRMSAQRAMHTTLASDIIAVRRYFENNPFLSFDDQADPNPEGFKVTYYAVSSATKKGAHGDGVIRFRMYIIEPAVDDGPSVGRLAKTWEFDPQQAMGWRVSRMSALGWPYLFHLNWGDADPYGREIRIVPEFVRRDGHVIRGSPKDLRVPPRRREIILLDEARL